MKKIGFVGPQRKIIRFEITGRKVLYFDDQWRWGIQIYPFDKKLVRKLLHAKRAKLQAVGLLITDANQGQNLKDYESCETEEDLVKMIKKDCKSKGLVEIK
jgi:hypothetical protein